MSDTQRAAMQEALEFVEFCWRDVSLNEYAEEQRSKVEVILRAALAEPSRSQKMRDAGFTPRDTRLECDECGAKVTRQMLPIHQCEQQAEPVKLHEDERYIQQMAGISTAALGYWKEGDPIHPDYITMALLDVAKLYAKYAALEKQQAEPPTPAPGQCYACGEYSMSARAMHGLYGIKDGDDE